MTPGLGIKPWTLWWEAITSGFDSFFFLLASATNLKPFDFLSTILQTGALKTESKYPNDVFPWEIPDFNAIKHAYNCGRNWAQYEYKFICCNEKVYCGSKVLNFCLNLLGIRTIKVTWIQQTLVKTKIILRFSLSGQQQWALAKTKLTCVAKNKHIYGSQLKSVMYMWHQESAFPDLHSENIYTLLFCEFV